TEYFRQCPLRHRQDQIRAFRQLRSNLPVRNRDRNAPPLTIAPLSFQMLWHQRSEGDAALGWLREVVMQ
ncbi:hypothetical protein Q4R52_21655, partial [Morganella morganii]